MAMVANIVALPVSSLLSVVLSRRYRRHIRQSVRFRRSHAGHGDGGGPSAARSHWLTQERRACRKRSKGRRRKLCLIRLAPELPVHLAMGVWYVIADYHC